MTKWPLPSDLASITFSQVFDFFPHLQNQMGHSFFQSLPGGRGGQ